MPNIVRRARACCLPALAVGIGLLAARPTLAGVGPAAPTFQLGWGNAGSGPAQFNGPWGAAVDSLGNVFVVDRFNGRVQKFDPLGNLLVTIGGMSGPLYAAVAPGVVIVPDNDVVRTFDGNGNLLSQWGSFGSGNGQFQSAAGVAIDAGGNVYVGDYQLNRVQKFTSTGVYVSQWGSTGSGNGQLSNPTGLCIDAAGNVYVADASNHRIQQFTSAGAYVSQWGGLGSGNGQLANPSSISTDALGNFYVGDQSNHRIQKFSPSHAYVSQFGSFGTGNGQFHSPIGTAVDGAGNVFVVDNGNNRVQKFSGAGVPVASMPGTFVAKWGSQGTGNGQFFALTAVDVDAAGEVYTLEANGAATNNRIQKFTGLGTYLTQWGTQGSAAGQFNAARGMACDLAGNVYVSDTGNNRVEVFSSNGVFVTQWGAPGTGIGQFNLSISRAGGVAVDLAGNVYVSDTGNHRVQKFTNTGTYLAQWGTFGTGNGQFQYPGGLAIDGAGNVYVADVDNNRIQKFTSSGAYLAQWGSVGGGAGQFSRPSDVSVGPDGNVSVADTENFRVQMFTSNGLYLSQFGTNSILDGGFGLVSSSAFDPAGNLYAVDYIGNRRVQRFAFAPVIAAISDVPGDQGGQVRLRVLRCTADAAGSSAPVLRYGVYRRIDTPGAPVAVARPGFERGVDRTSAQLAGWDFVGSFDANGSTVYSVVVPTLANSTPASSWYTAYFVSAVTADPLKYFDSAVQYGYSVDNLPPPAPTPFTAAYAAGATHLHWGVSAASDFAAFRLYRGANAGFTPGDANRIATTTDTSYADVGAAGSWYKLSAVDLNGNESIFAVLGPGQTADVAPAPVPEFALERAGANPATNGALSVRFTLPVASPAKLELIDVAGRAVVSRDIGGLGAGAHELDLSSGVRIAPGLYFVRLSQGARQQTVRVSVIE